MLDADRAWLAQRRFADLDERAEQALREAGLAFSQDARAELYLRRAELIAPDHEAVLIAHYRYYLYKHRFEEASRYARRCVTLTAERLGLPGDPLRVRAADLAAIPAHALAALRAWLFSCQAYGYVLMRADHRAAGAALLDHLTEVDRENQSRTVELCAAIKKAEASDD